jgi:hypothetical protein
MPGELVKLDDEFSRLMGVVNLSTTLDLSKQSGRENLAKALSYENPKLDEVINTEIGIMDIVMRDVESTDEETGEVEVYSGTTLICDGDRYYFTGSNGVKRSLFLATLYRGKPPWNPPLRVLVKQRNFKTKSGAPGRTYELKVVEGNNGQ